MASVAGETPNSLPRGEGLALPVGLLLTGAGCIPTWYEIPPLFTSPLGGFWFPPIPFRGVDIAEGQLIGAFSLAALVVVAVECFTRWRAARAASLLVFGITTLTLGCLFFLMFTMDTADGRTYSPWFWGLCACALATFALSARRVLPERTHEPITATAGS